MSGGISPWGYCLVGICPGVFVQGVYVLCADCGMTPYYVVCLPRPMEGMG